MPCYGLTEGRQVVLQGLRQEALLQMRAVRRSHTVGTA
jgi:hypothetical protein